MASELVEQLEDLFEVIGKAYTNFKKCSKARKTKGYIDTKMKCVEEYWNNFRRIHHELLKITTKDERMQLSYFTNDIHSECEEVFTCLKADMADYLTSVEYTAQKIESTTQRNSTEVKLPRIDLPHFSGAYEEWQSFEDTFNSLINNNKAISEVEKLHYLKSCLTGEAKNTIKHFQVTEKNYAPAWETLRNRYSQKRLIVNAILRRLFTLRKITTPSPIQLKSLVDSTRECLNSLNSMNISTENWDPIIIFLIIQKLDQETHHAWETYVSTEYYEEMPLFTNLITFLENKICTLELTSGVAVRDKPRERTYYSTAPTQQTTCPLCTENHAIYHCKVFGKLNPDERSEKAKQYRLCYNCLTAGHSIFNCKQRMSCRLCGRRHHTLLHSSPRKEESKETEEKNTPAISSMHVCNTQNVEDTEKEDSQLDLATLAVHYATNNAHRRSLLATAVVTVMSDSAQPILLRALIDMGSESSFVSERATQLLMLNKTPIKATVTGLGATETTVKYITQLEVSPRFESNYKLQVEAYVIPKHLTTQLPSTTIATQSWSHIEGLKLADPRFNVRGRIDMLLGLKVYAGIVKQRIIRGPAGTPCAQETSLGWILFGKIGEETHDESIIVHHHTVENVDVHNMLKQMWHIDDTGKRDMTAEEKLCEVIYTQTHSRLPDGRYEVKLPFKNKHPIEEIGDTKEKAIIRSKQLEWKLQQNSKLKEEYTKVFDEYLELNHMEEVPKEDKDKPAVYLPHHAVVKEERETTKVRVVFDASCKGTKGKSLNDTLLVGPQLQKDLRDLIMKWRIKPICFIADITKMYRQVLVKKEDADYQRILWRKNINEDIKEYRMLRVTFGTAAAPYLAVKTLFQLAEDEGKDHTDAAKVIREDFFVDDCLSGHMSTNVEDAIELSKEVNLIMNRGGFDLQKWASNSQEFIKEIEPSHRSKHASIDNSSDCIIKTLGLSWNIVTDTFHYQIKLPEQPQITTKRSILADIQRLFDPLGWISPAIVLTKMLIQQLWLERLEWDDAVNDALSNEWSKIRASFEKLNSIQIDRWIKTDCDDVTKTTLFGFCDASAKAICAVVYSRVETKNGEIKTTIIASKTRVAPIKTVSLPRLELCGALLLAKLLTQVCEAMSIPREQVFAWTDSTVVISWLFGDPHRWKPFVSNRVIEILDHVSNTQWFHVQSKENPADIGSRGLELSQLIENKLWWEGPEWLKADEVKLTRPTVITTEIERKKTLQVNLKVECDKKKIKFENFDSLQELLKTMVYCIRFINSKKRSSRLDQNISTEELEEALLKCIRITQTEEFGEELERLQRGKDLKKDSKLIHLTPYLDENNILRVGGRLRNSDLETDKKHPIILGTRNHLTPLIIADAHRKTLHGGIQLMLCYLRTKYWIIHAKNTVKACIHKCIICARERAAIRTQIMGDLPKVRVTQARPFLHSGVDFAGPLQILMSKGRGAKLNKAYIAIFICMATKAVHLELVGDLTSESFIGAFRRFVARRGKCTHIWSDQGRNFICANKELAAAFREASFELPGNLAEILSSDGTQWHFIPPYSPNFGGLWEAGVKSTKYHLKRILTGNLTFEEMTTTLCQIEACLNSRPLVPIDDCDPDIIDPLTPGHFLMGETPVIIPSPDLRNINVNKLSRWQHTQKLVRDFWNRWQSEYLSRLQERPKWLKPQKELEVGDIVLCLKSNRVCNFFEFFTIEPSSFHARMVHIDKFDTRLSPDAAQMLQTHARILASGSA